MENQDSPGAMWHIFSPMTDTIYKPNTEKFEDYNKK